MGDTPDFSGYATKAGLVCSDGLTITSGAFQHQDGVRVPLMWQHKHNESENVLGYGVLEQRDDGVYVRGYFTALLRGVVLRSSSDTVTLTRSRSLLTA